MENRRVECLLFFLDLDVDFYLFFGVCCFRGGFGLVSGREKGCYFLGCGKYVVLVLGL